MPLLWSFDFLLLATYKYAAPMGLGKATLALNPMLHACGPCHPESEFSDTLSGHFAAIIGRARDGPAVTESQRNCQGPNLMRRSFLENRGAQRPEGSIEKTVFSAPVGVEDRLEDIRPDFDLAGDLRSFLASEAGLQPAGVGRKIRNRPFGEGGRQQRWLDVQIALTSWGFGRLISLQIARKMALKWALKKSSKNS